MEILLAADLPPEVLGNLQRLGIQAESDPGASLEQTVQRASRERAILMVPGKTMETRSEILDRAPGVIVLGKGASNRCGLSDPVQAWLEGFHPEPFRRHVSFLYGQGPSLVTLRSQRGAATSEGITLPRGTREEFLHFGAVGMEELNQAGILLAGFTRTSRGYFVERRPAPFHLLGFMRTGSLEISEEKSPPRRVGAGFCFFLPAGFRGFYRVERTADFLWFHIEKDRQGFVAGGRVAVRPAYPGLPWVQTARQFLEESRGTSYDRPMVLLRLVQLLEMQLHRAIRALGLEPGMESSRCQLLRAICCVEENLTEPWSVSKLARASGLSTARLYREIHTHFRKTPALMVQEIRIRHAAELLLTKNAKLYEVAAQTGYGDPFSFSRAFKRVMGSSPSHYRDGGSGRGPSRAGGSPLLTRKKTA